MNKKNIAEKMSREEYLYHNTVALLKNFREVTWSVEASSENAYHKFEKEMGCKLEEFLELSYAAGADLSGTNIEEQMRTLERNRKMLIVIENAAKMVKDYHHEGELYYSILYHTYLSKKSCKSVEEILKKISQDVGYISEKTYYRKRNAATKTFGNALWGYCQNEKEKIEVVELFEKVYSSNESNNAD